MQATGRTGTLTGMKKGCTMKRAQHRTGILRLAGLLALAAGFFSFGLPLRGQQPDTLKGPVVNITVNKETDERGNIIRYDSTYTWYWSSGDTLTAGDTAFFRRFFSGGGGWHFNPGMLMPDSLPGLIFSPFDEALDPFFFGFPDTSAIRHFEQLFREFIEPSWHLPGEEFFRSFGIPLPEEIPFPDDSLFERFFRRELPPPPGHIPPKQLKQKGKIVIL